MSVFQQARIKAIAGFLLSLAIISVSGQNYEGLKIGGELNDVGAGILLDNEGDLVIAGTSRSYGNTGDDMILVKLNLEGEVYFQKTYFREHHERARWIEQAPDGNYLIFGEVWDGGYGREDMYLMKVGRSGEKIWEQYYGGYHTDQGFCARAIENGYIGLGYTSSQEGTTRGNFYLVRTDPDGNRLWENNYGTEYLDFGFSVLPAVSEGFWLLGAAGGFFNPARADFMNPDSDLLLIKTDQNGNELYRKYYGGMLHDWGRDMVEADDGGLYILGSSQSKGAGNFDMYLLKTDKEGDKIWEKTFGESDFEYGTAISLDPAGNLFLMGTKQIPDLSRGPDFYIVKAAPDGEVLWEQTIGGPGSDYGFDVVSLADSGCVLVGGLQNIQTGNSDIYVVRLDKNGRIMGLDVPPDILNTLAIKFFPNPADEIASLEWEGLPPEGGYIVSVYSLDGKLLQRQEYGNEVKVDLNLRELPAGTWLYQVIYKGGRLSGKFMTR